MESVIKWIAVDKDLPELDKNVLVVTGNGSVGWGMRSEFTHKGKKEIEWGNEENGWEYWHKIKDVVLWAEFPKPPF